jgi:drug/metabolite transporter (DMT)-like permease
MRPFKQTGRDLVTAAAGASVVTRAIAYMGFAALLSSFLHIGVRTMAERGMPSAEIVFLRTLLTILVTLPFVFRPGQSAWRTNVPSGHLLRGAVGMTSMWAWYYALSQLPLGDAATLGQTTGLFVVLGSAFWFREQVGRARWLALLTGMLGAIIVLKPGAGALSWPALCALGSSALWALSLLMAKGMAKYDSTLTITFYQPLVIMPLALMAAVPTWVAPKLADIGLLTVMAAAAGVSNYCMVKALSTADASITAPIDYTKLLWTTLAGYILFGEWPGLSSWVGGALIVAASLFIVIYERRAVKPVSHVP